MPLFHQRFFLFLSIGLTAMACRKAPDPTPTQTQTLLLSKKVTTYYSSSSLGKPFPGQDGNFQLLTRRQDAYEYDQQNRLVSYSTRNPDRPDYTYEWGDVAYEYVGNQLVYTNLRVFPLIPVKYTLNDQGYITELNRYDQEGYLVFRQEGPNATTTQTISEGNISKEVYQDAIGRLTTVYEYDLSKPGLPRPDKAMWGRPSRNLVTKVTQLHESFTGVAPVLPNYQVTTYVYAFDAKGVVQQQSAYIQRSLWPNAAIVERELQVSVYEFK